MKFKAKSTTVNKEWLITSVLRRLTSELICALVAQTLFIQHSARIHGICFVEWRTVAWIQ